jgi:hypothetical protein
VGIVLLPIPIILVFIFSRCCCCVQVKNFFKRQNDNIFFNGIIQFFECTLLMIGVSSTINIYQVFKKVANKNASYYFAICAISAILLYMITLISYLYCKFGNLSSEPEKKRVGATYTHLAFSEAGRSVLVFLFL